MNEVINRKKRTNKLTTTFVFNDKEISSPNEVANHFCEYFTNIGVNLAKDIPNSTVSNRTYLSGNYVNSMSLELTTEEEIVEIIKRRFFRISSNWPALKNTVMLCAKMQQFVVFAKMAGSKFKSINYWPNIRPTLGT